MALETTRHKNITTLPLLQALIIIVLATATIPSLLRPSLADVGTAAHYAPPYLPTACYGKESGEFPTSNLFGAAGEGIWDNGASCGRQYQVRCISAAVPGTCVLGSTILVKIVDYAASLPSTPSAGGTTMILSTTAFSALANVSALSVNIEFQQV